MAWRTRWLLYAGLALIPVIGGLGGGVVASSKAPVYSAESRLSVVLTDTNTAQNLAENYSRYLNRAAVAPDLEPAAAASLLDVTASPIPDSNIIRVEATALAPQAALAAAKEGTSVLQTRVDELSGATRAKQTLVEYTKIARQVADAQERVNASQGRGSAYTTNAPKLATLQAQADSLKQKYQTQMASTANTELSLVQSATPTGDNVTSRKHVYQLAGLGGGALIAYILGRLATSLPLRREDREARTGGWAPGRRPTPAAREAVPPFPEFFGDGNAPEHRDGYAYADAGQYAQYADRFSEPEDLPHLLDDVRPVPRPAEVVLPPDPIRDERAPVGPAVPAQPGHARPGHAQPAHAPSAGSATTVLPPVRPQPRLNLRTSQPGSAQPGAVQPGVVQPGVAQPGVAQPGAAQPGTSPDAPRRRGLASVHEQPESSSPRLRVDWP